MFTTICSVYALFWGPLFLVVIFGSRSTEEGRGLASVGPPQNPAWHQVSLYICFAHAFINPTVFLVLHAGLKDAASRVFCCFLGSQSNRDDEDDYRTLHLDNVNYDRIINFNGAPSFLPLLPPLPPPPPSALFSQDTQSHHMWVVSIIFSHIPFIHLSTLHSRLSQIFFSNRWYFFSTLNQIQPICHNIGVAKKHHSIKKSVSVRNFNIQEQHLQSEIQSMIT